MKKLFSLLAMTAILSINTAIGQWTFNGNHIYNSNTGYVGIGNNSPSTLLFVAKNMTEPTITVRNLGGTGGATYTMTDDASGANWKFKATNTGGFKIRDHANLLDVFVIEPNSASNAIYIKTGGNVGIGTSVPASSALVDMSSTTKGVLLPRMTQAQIAAISSPADGLILFCTTDSKLYVYVQGAGAWKEILFGSGIIAPPSSCGNPITTTHVAGNVAPVTKAVTYGTVTNIPGEPTKCWITSNLGADHQATAVDDATEASAGWYWQFNRMQGYKHDGAVRTPNTTWITSIDENLDWLTVNDPCNLLLGSGWRLPTLTEWTNVFVSGGWNNWDGPWNSALKMHAAGYLYAYSGVLQERGIYGDYWSSNQDGNFSGWHLAFTIGGSSFYGDDKVWGMSSRCLKD